MSKLKEDFLSEDFLSLTIPVQVRNSLELMTQTEKLLGECSSPFQCSAGGVGALP